MNGCTFGWLRRFPRGGRNAKGDGHNVMIMGPVLWYNLLCAGRCKPGRDDRKNIRPLCFISGTVYSMSGVAEWIFTTVILCSLVMPGIASDEGWEGVGFIDPTYRVPLDPVFLTSSSNITVREGGKAELPCRIKHQGTKRVAWRSVDQDRFLIVGTMVWLPEDNIQIKHVKPEEEIDEWTLVIPSVQKSDAGLYECQLTSIGGYHTLVQLNVVGPPITEPAVSLTGTPYVERGALINLTCIASGGTQIAEDIDWFKDGNIISSPKYKDYIITKFRSLEKVALVSTLTVDRATEQHAGTYVCRSSHNELRDITVQVLMTGRDNKKRGTDSSSQEKEPNGSPIQASTVFIVIVGVVCSTLWCRGYR